MFEKQNGEKKQKKSRNDPAGQSARMQGLVWILSYPPVVAKLPKSLSKRRIKYDLF